MKATDQQAFENFPKAPDDACVGVAVVAALCGCHVATVWERVKKNQLPKPIKIGSSQRWNVGKLRKVLQGEPA